MKLTRRFFWGIKDDSGSAIIEFIALGIPLFLPLAIFLTAVNHDASLQSQTRNFARQIARIYVSGPSQSVSVERVNVLKSIFKAEILNRIETDLEPEIVITCSDLQCLSPGSTVKVNLSIFNNKHRLLARSSTQEIVDQWKAN